MRITTKAVLVCLLGFSLSALADSKRPGTVGNVQSEGVSGPAIVVSWNKPWDNVGVDGYNIYRDGQYFATIFNSTRFIDDTVREGRSYEYGVVAFDRARNFSTMSLFAKATGGASTSANNVPSTSSGMPSAPRNLRAEVRDSRSANLTWSAPSGGAEGYNIYKNGRYFRTVKGSNSFIAWALDETRTYRFQVVAFRNDLYSSKSEEITVQTGSESRSASTPSNDSEDSAVPDGYSLVFNDEFNRSSIDSSKWNTSYRWGPDIVINQEEQYYVDTLNQPDFGASPFLSNGSRLTIRATKTPNGLRSKAGDQRYLSGAMTTYNKFRMKYGYVEMRAKLPSGKGLWPAFWLLHQHGDGARPEIDVMELLGENPNLVYQTYHYYKNGKLNSTPSFQVPGPNYSNGFHTYGMLWERGRITWYVDGIITNSYESDNVSTEEMYLLVNLALGGIWSGSPDGSTSFPADFVIDYIRAYQK